MDIIISPFILIKIKQVTLDFTYPNTEKVVHNIIDLTEVVTNKHVHVEIVS